MNTTIIAHRALLEGPDAGLENQKESIEKALAMGFDVEVDVPALFYRSIFDEKLGYYKPDYIGIHTGHDEPIAHYLFDEINALLEKYPDSTVWFHAKTLAVYTYLVSDWGDFPHNHEVFAHDKDFAALTYPGLFMWMYPSTFVPKDANFVVDVLPEKSGPPSTFKNRYQKLVQDKAMPAAICTDYPIILKRTLEELESNV